MLAYALAIAVALSSLVLFSTAFLMSDIHRQDDFLWSGVGLFYALVLWFCATRITGGVLLGQAAATVLLISFNWQTLKLRKAIANPEQAAQIYNFSILQALNNLFSKKPPSPQPTTTLEKTAKLTEEEIAIPETTSKEAATESTVTKEETISPPPTEVSPAAAITDETSKEEETISPPPTEVSPAAAIAAETPKVEKRDRGLFGKLFGSKSKTSSDSEATPTEKSSVTETKLDDIVDEEKEVVKEPSESILETQKSESSQPANVELDTVEEQSEGTLETQKSESSQPANVELDTVEEQPEGTLETQKSESSQPANVESDTVEEQPEGTLETQKSESQARPATVESDNVEEQPENISETQKSESQAQPVSSIEDREAENITEPIEILEVTVEETTVKIEDTDTPTEIIAQEIVVEKTQEDLSESPTVETDNSEIKPSPTKESSTEAPKTNQENAGSDIDEFLEELDRDRDKKSDS